MKHFLTIKLKILSRSRANYTLSSPSTNTMHNFFPQIFSGIDVEFLQHPTTLPQCSPNCELSQNKPGTAIVVSIFESKIPTHNIESTGSASTSRLTIMYSMVEKKETVCNLRLINSFTLVQLFARGVK